MSVELPKDAEGREIPLDTVVLFDPYGKPVNIVRWAYTTDFNLKDNWANSWRAINEDLDGLEPELMYLTPPDTWEKLEEDLRRGAGAESYQLCKYANGEAFLCSECRFLKSEGSCARASKVLADILERIRKLRGES